MINFIDTAKEARDKAALAEDTSNIEASDSEAIRPVKRKHRYEHSLKVAI